MNMCLYMSLCTISLNLPNLDVIYHTQHSNGSLIFKEDIESFLSFDLPCLFYLFTGATLASASTTSSGKTELAHSSSRPAYIRKLVFRIVTLCSHWSLETWMWILAIAALIDLQYGLCLPTVSTSAVTHNLIYFDINNFVALVCTSWMEMLNIWFLLSPAFALPCPF